MATNIFTKGAVLGAPPSFHHISDPNQRVFLGAMNPPPVVQIIPGLPDFRGYRSLTEDIEKAVDEYSQLNKNDTEPLERARKRLKSKAAADSKFFSFNTAVPDYLNTVRAMISRAAARMVGLETEMAIELADWGGLMFYLDKSTSITESFSNTWEDSIMKNLLDSGGGMARQAQYVLNQMQSGELTQKEQEAIRDQQDQSVTDTMNFLDKKQSSSTKKLNTSAIGSIIQGDTLIMPKMWTASETNRSYDLAFRFETPYGDAASILRDVLTPYFCLLPYALGRQVSTNAYTSPFMLKVDSPGWFSIEAGIVTSMTVKRGPNDEDWTETGYARSIEVNMTVEDIYPTLTASSSHLGLESNFQLANYLDNISGLDYTSMGSATSNIDQLKGYINNVMMNATSIDDIVASKIRERFDTAPPFKF